MSISGPPADTPERQAYYDKISKRNLNPLWSVMGAIITREPRSACVPHLWHFAEMKELLLEAGFLITAKEAERRVLMLENPGMPGQNRITTSLYAGLQLVLPGEVAPAHRHSQSAVRFVLDGAGAHTSVDGERTIMQVGDFVITPPRAWHDHGNHSDEPMIWLDGLDIPTVSFYDASFAESSPEDERPVTRPVGHSMAQFGANMLPVDYEATQPSSPIFNYPYDRTREALETMRRQQDWDPCHGLKMRFVNPVDGGSPMPTMSAFMQLLPKDFATSAYRSTDATIFAVVEGRGTTTIDGQPFTWGPKDVFVVPSWKWVSHHADEDAVIFSYSDRIAQQKLGLWREDRGNRVKD
ncbi:gentisate 1,2-dioxygenase (plasmid) [Azospirillum argentinense]|uniref:Gentisate 1,2-dioxygenase n=1 Tax=Azospirillum argentinense TaxID=2970906 RepID=A0A060DT49_9PROT|nr:gentisate 1,2-dioxygenase [Azospirillum argentinense]AIB15932.1 gentisate 1,2-dioxygenase [Azospirillum argentinense]EZQ03408.1 gentisate 1,2-dioxygenase [Azospirillum argentinense]